MGLSLELVDGFINGLLAAGAAKGTLVGIRSITRLHVVFGAGRQAGSGDQGEGEDVE